jgi:hypothetical protein
VSSLISRILTWISAIAIYLIMAEAVLASPLIDRIHQYPNWHLPAQLSHHEGELTYPEWFRGRWIATSTLLDRLRL